MILILDFVIIIFLIFLCSGIVLYFKNKKFLKKFIAVSVAGSLVLTGIYFFSERGEGADGEAFIWHQDDRYGFFSHWEVNRSYAKKFLKDNMAWRLQASPNNVTWYDANQLLHIGLLWDNETCSYKITLTLNTTGAPQSLFYRFDLACNKSLKSYINKESNNSWIWELVVQANNTMDYTIVFNWSDIRNLVQTGKVRFNRGVNNNFFWFRIQTVSKIAVGKVFVVDPAYGVITAGVVSSYEWDAATGYNDGPNGAIQVNDTEYWLVVSSGVDADGWARTIRVHENNGTIQASVVDSLEYDTTDGALACVRRIPTTDNYVIAYNDALKVTVCTIEVREDGSIGAAIIDSQVLTYKALSIFLLGFTDNVYSVFYNEAVTSDGFFETVWIDYDGMINNTLLDIEEWETAYAYYPWACTVDSNTIAVTTVSASATGNFRLMTYNITTSGIITDEPATSWNYEANPGYFSTIIKTGVDIYEITYADSGYDIQTKTLKIPDNGMMVKSWIDTLTVIAGTTIYYICPFFVHDPSTTADHSGIMGVSLYGIGSGEGDGYMYTWNITSTGGIGAAKIGSGYEWETVSNMVWSSTHWINESRYLVVYTGVDSDGWAKTLFIKTNWGSPVQSNPVPVNGSTTSSITPWCNIDVADPNGDTMTVCFYENTTGGWVKRQTNTSVSNGTVRWRYTQAVNSGTKYWWRVYANDSIHNISGIYHFTTVANTAGTATSPTPTNGSTDVHVYPRLSVVITDFESDTMTVTWQTNASGIWTTYQVNSSVATGTTLRDMNASFAHGHFEWYYWLVWVYDGSLNRSYWFRFKTEGTNPVISNPVPANESTGVELVPFMNITVNNVDGTEMDVYWYTNHSHQTILHPVGVGPYNELQNNSGNFNYEAVDEVVFDDTDYVYNDGATGTIRSDTYELQDYTASYHIFNVAVHSMVMNVWSDSLPVAYAVFRNTISNGTGTIQLGTIYTPPSDDTYYEYITVWDDNPWTGVEWTVEDVNCLEAGIRLRSYVAGNGGRCAQTWLQVNEPGWYYYQINASSTNGTYHMVNNDFSEYSTTYWWQVEAYSPSTGNDTLSPIYHFTTGDAPASNITFYNTTIRTDGLDYFVWLGGNVSAWHVSQNLTGFDALSDYIAIFQNNGYWLYYYGSGAGTNWTLHTFDVVKVMLVSGAGTCIFNMTANPGVNYSLNRTVFLKKVTDGYNYTGYTNVSKTNLTNLNTSLALPLGYSVSLWNETTFVWDTWISWFGFTNSDVLQYDVVMTKIDSNKQWEM